MKRNLIILTALSALLFGACKSTGYLGTVSTRNIDYSATYTEDGAANHEAKLAFVLILFPIQVDDFNAVEVLDQAMLAKGYEFMTDVKLEVSMLWLLLYAETKYTLEGKGWVKQGARAGLEQSGPDYLVADKDANGKTIVRSVTKTEYEQLAASR